MKQLSRDEMKKVNGALAAPNPGCGQYQGQTTYICGTQTYQGNTWVDFCFCNGTNVPGGCHVLLEA